MGTVLHRLQRCISLPRKLMFQSPSRWGRCCIAGSFSRAKISAPCFSPLLDGDGVASFISWRLTMNTVGVSVPFSMGTVLHPGSLRAIRACHLEFQSPSRWGRCCIAGSAAAACNTATFVSVPFSMGTVLHRTAGAACNTAIFCFSPLLDGDGVASEQHRRIWHLILLFQSPSRWGRCCI